MKEPIAMKLTIIFDGVENIWATYFHFENDMLHFFDELNLETQVVKGARGQNVGEYILLVQRKQTIKNMPEQKPAQQPKDQVKNVMESIGYGKPTRPSRR